MDSERPTSTDQALRQKFTACVVDLNHLIGFLRNQVENSYNSGKYSIWSNLKRCTKLCLELIESSAEADLNSSYFGFEVYLAEFEKLVRNCTESINAKTQNYRLDFQLEDVGFLNNFVNNIRSWLYLKIDSSRECTSSIDFIESPSLEISDVNMPVLDKYLTVGEALKDHKVTDELVSEIEQLHLDPNPVSIYMTIVGPSLMGKTQSALTLAHRLNVIYVNFTAILGSRDIVEIQSIYSLFKGLARIVKKCISIDMANPAYDSIAGNTTEIKELTYPFRTLGLIYVIMRTRQLRGDVSVKDWLLELLQIGNTMIPSLTIDEFKTKCGDLGNQVIFIDELPVPIKGSHSDVIKFLRNLSRAVKLPCILSGTNSRVNNLIGDQSSLYYSRLEGNGKPWVKVMVRTPNASVKSFCKLVQFKNQKGEQCDLKKYVIIPNENDRDYEIDYNLIFNDFYTTDNPDLEELMKQNFAPIQKLIEFLILQSRTSIPGMVPLFLNKLFELLSEHRDDPRKLWTALNEKAAEVLSVRKCTLIEEDGLLASAYILIFDSLPLRKEMEEGSHSSKLVEKHLFRYGCRDDSCFRLDLKKITQSTLDFYRNDKLYVDKCNFPELNEDFFTTFLCLNMWNMSPLTNEEINYASNLGILTLAGMYQKYLLSVGKYNINPNRRLPDSLSFEILAHWSICQASHQDLNGNNEGKAVFTEFVKQLQPFDVESGPVKFSGLSGLPQSLNDILARVKVPYLMRYPSDASFKRSLRSSLGDLIKFGESRMPPNAVGLDVKFDLEFDGAAKKGFIECKLWTAAVGYPMLIKYYKKACLCRFPLSFLICKNLRKSFDLTTNPSATPVQPENDPPVEQRIPRASVTQAIKRIEELTISDASSASSKKLKGSGDDDDEDWKDDYVDDGVYDDDDDEDEDYKEEKNPKPKEDYVAMLEQLWLNPSNHINIYSVEYEQEKDLSNKNEGTFAVKELKVFDNPKGAFILVESKFNPPDLASSK